MRQFYLIDTTLRDGEQAPGVVFSFNEKLEIASILDAAGVPEVELGTPAISQVDVEHIRKMASSGFKFRTACWARALEKDIVAAEKTGVQQINISFPVSEILLRVLEKDRFWLTSEIERLVLFARKRFEYVSVGAQDASRAEENVLIEFVEINKTCGAHRIRFADTVGVMTPMKVHQWFDNFSTKFPDVDFEFHGHNDLGMATGNTITALVSGCNCASVTVNGLGERTGNAALEEIAAALKVSYNIDCGIDLKKLVDLSCLVARASGRAIHPSKPVSGEMAFSHESGVHCHGLEKDALAYQPFLPGDIGRKQNYVTGRHSGKVSVEKILIQSGISLEKNKFGELLSSLKSKSLREKRGLTEEEVMDMARRM